MHTPHAGSTHAPMPHLAACNPAELDSLCSRDSRCGTEIPSMHVIAASSPGPRSRGDRRRAHIIKTCPFRHPPPTPPHSPARHSPRQPYEPPVGGILSRYHICLHLPASPCTSLHLQSPTSAPVAALITAPNLVPRGAHHGAVWSHVLRPAPSSLGAAFARAKRPVQPPDKPSACRSLQIIIDGCCLLIVIGVPQNVSLSSSRRRATACSPPRQRGSRAHRSHTGRPGGRGS
jgi:hypothetical protein